MGPALHWYIDTYAQRSTCQSPLDRSEYPFVCCLCITGYLRNIPKRKQKMVVSLQSGMPQL